MKVKLTKIQSTHNNLRTNEIIGETENLPELGKPFVMTAEPLTKGATFRFVCTTDIQSIETRKHISTFTTLNSTYEVEVLEENRSEAV